MDELRKAKQRWAVEEATESMKQVSKENGDN